MSPKSQNGPTLFLQSCCHLNVPLHVAFDFGNPKITVAFYFVLCLLPIISMPKIPITEYCDFPSKKCNIRFSENGLIVSRKSSKALANKFLAQEFLQRGITIAHSAHIFMYLLFTLLASHCASLQPSRYRPISSEVFDIHYKISALLSYKIEFFLPCYVALLQSHCSKCTSSKNSIPNRAQEPVNTIHKICTRTIPVFLGGTDVALTNFEYPCSLQGDNTVETASFVCRSIVLQGCESHSPIIFAFCADRF